MPIVPAVVVPFTTTRAGSVPAPLTSSGRALLDDGSWGSISSGLSLTNNEAGTVVAGTPVYIDAANGFKKAKADDIATGRAIGILQADTAPGATGTVLYGNTITLTTAEWDAVAGTTGGLTFDVPYYLSATTAGRLTATPPSTAGHVVQQMLVAISTTIAVIKISDPEVIGAGNNLIQLTNNNGSSAIICTPVYSDAAEGFDLGIADGSNKSTIIGLVADTTIASSVQGNVAVGGIMVATTAQWDAVCGTTGGLTFNTTYYLHPTIAGRLTATAPTTPGQEVVQVITALSTTEARIAIQPPILL